MPIALRVKELKPGMIVARAVRNQYSTLLAAGRKIAEAEIDILSRLLPGGFVLIRDPLLDEKVEFGDLTHDQDVALQARKIVTDHIDRAQPKLGRNIALRNEEVVELHAAVKEAIDFLAANPVVSAYLPQVASEGYLSVHQMNVFYLCMVIGREIRGDIVRERFERTRATQLTGPSSIIQLGLAAALHDTGLVAMPDLFRASATLSEEDREKVRRHSVEGLKQLGGVLPALARVAIRQHHENALGTGYPRGLQGEKINVLARVIRLVDAFDTYTARDVFPEAKGLCRALFDITLGRYRDCFDKAARDVLLRRVVPFEPGTRLRLSDGTFAVTVNNKPDDPFHPTVIVVFDPAGKRIPVEAMKPPMDMASSPLKITQAGDEDATFLHKPEAAEPIKAQPGQGQGLFDLLFP